MPKSLMEEKIAALLAVAEKCNLYGKEGFTPENVMAICRKKAAFILEASTKGALNEIMKPSDVRYNGNEFVAAGSYCIAEEELIIWSMKSLRAPLRSDEMKRFEKLFKDIFPENADIFGEKTIYKKEEDRETMEIKNGTIFAEFTAEVPQGTIESFDESLEASDKKADEHVPETIESVNTEVSAPVKPAVELISDPAVIITMATEKLEKEANTSGGQNVPAIPIYNYLKKICAEDVPFAVLVLQEHKTLLKCFNYVYEQVEKTLTVRTGTQSVWVSDEATYKMAEDYYRLDDAEIERKRAEEKKAREDKQKEEAEKRKVQQANKIAAGKTSAGASAVSTDGVNSNNEATPVKKKVNEQMSLFDLEEPA